LAQTPWNRIFPCLNPRHWSMPSNVPTLTFLLTKKWNDKEKSIFCAVEGVAEETMGGAEERDHWSFQLKLIAHTLSFSFVLVLSLRTLSFKQHSNRKTRTIPTTTKLREGYLIINRWQKEIIPTKLFQRREKGGGWLFAVDVSIGVSWSTLHADRMQFQATNKAKIIHEGKSMDIFGRCPWISIGSKSEPLLSLCLRSCACSS
jgi:hypothetical protein